MDIAYEFRGHDLLSREGDVGISHFVLTDLYPRLCIFRATHAANMCEGWAKTLRPAPLRNITEALTVEHHFHLTNVIIRR